MPLPNISTAAFAITGGTNDQLTLDDRLGRVLTPFDFNPTGLDLAGNVVDAAPALQAMFDAAFGTAASPNGLTNAHLNVPCFIPPGRYNLESSLVLTRVVGGLIYGGGLTATQLNYSGSLASPAPVLRINGMARTTIRSISFNNTPSDANGIAVDYDWNNAAGGDGLKDNMFFMCGFGGRYGIIVANQGYGGQGLQLIGPIGSGSTISTTICMDIRGASSRVHVLHPSMSDYGIIYKIRNGANLTVIGGSGESEITNYDIAGTDTKVTTIGNRSESDQVYELASGTLHAIGTNMSNATTTDTVFANVTGGKALFDTCNLNDNTGQAGISEITGNGGQIYLRGCRFETGYLDNYTGTVVQNI